MMAPLITSRGVDKSVQFSVAENFKFRLFSMMSEWVQERPIRSSTFHP